MADLAPIPHGRATGLAMLATMKWVSHGAPEAYARVAKAMAAADPIAAYDRLVRATAIKISLEGDGLDLGKPELLAEHMASPANAPMRKIQSALSQRCGIGGVGAACLRSSLTLLQRSRRHGARHER